MLTLAGIQCLLLTMGDNDETIIPRVQISDKPHLGENTYIGARYE